MYRNTLIYLSMMTNLTAHAGNPTIFFGTDGHPDSKGIYSATLDTETGNWTGKVELAAELAAPGFFARHPSLPILYSAGRIPGTRDNVAAAYQMKAGESRIGLEPLNRVPTGTGLITHLAVDPKGRFLVTVFYSQSEVAVFPLDAEGRLGERTQLFNHGEGTGIDPDRQEAAHPHYVTFDPSGEYVLVPDLGADAIIIYKVDVDGRLVRHGQAPSTPGAGPRHMKFTDDGRFALVLNELSLTVATYAWDSGQGTLEPLHEIQTLPGRIKEQEVSNTASEILIHPNGRFVYAGNRGNDSITVLQLDQKSGELEVVEVEPTRTAWPRNFAIDPTGNWLVCAGQHGSTAGVFAIDKELGVLTYKVKSSIVVPQPICVFFVSPD